MLTRNDYIAMLKIISANLNGIRSASTKGFFEWMGQQDADFVCVQEVKAQDADLTDTMRSPIGMGNQAYQGYFHFAEKKGYSGTGIYTRQQPDKVITGFGVTEFDEEGRYTELVYPKLSVVSVYLPSGSSSEERQQAKFRFLEVFLPHLQCLRASKREVVICGDWNIAHTEKDLKNWKGNLKNSGFLPEERAWMTQLLGGQMDWVDVYRSLYPEASDEGYTWWSNRGQARAKNVGWRIDYQIATPSLGALARSASIFKDQRFSDHAPLTVEYA
jgi:exodeoxyribonuclease-3